DLVAALAGGPVGLSEPETLLLLNAAVQSGIAEATRGRRRVEAPFLSLEEVERVGPGELLPPEVRRRPPELAAVVGLGPPAPFDAAAASCRDGLGAVAGATAYLRDPALAIPDGPFHEALREARDEALRLAAGALPLAVAGRGSEVLDAADRARRAFAATYES